ncbi:MAG: HD domain-containing protein [Dehalobacterium formicoaceticum]
MLDKAIRIAAKAHEGQMDKAGQPYILHPLRVMFMRRDETERICAVLHDVIEDSDITIEYLRKEGFSEEVLSALNSLTKRENENYDDFIGRVIENKTACKVKLADLSDNMDLSRISNPIQEDYQRVEKYRKAAERIFEIMDFENDNEYRVSKEIEINGCVLVPQSCSEDDFLHKFIDFIENNYWSFGGGVKEIDEAGD